MRTDNADADFVMHDTGKRGKFTNAFKLLASIVITDQSGRGMLAASPSWGKKIKYFIEETALAPEFRIK